MRGVVCRAFGPLEDLVVEERAPQPCSEGLVRLAVDAAGVSYVDGLIVQGRYQIKPPLPYRPGSEVAGRVVEVGPGVQGWAEGDRAFANVGVGGWATEVVAPATAVRATPAALSDGQAATFTQSYLTAWFALHERARARPGQWLLVLGAGGGVGLAAVDVGRAMGLRVIAAASSPAKRAAAAAAGAEVVLDSRATDVKAAARDHSGGGVDLVYDPVGGAAGEAALRALGEDGQLLVIGFASGDIPRLPANQVLLRNRRVTGVDWGAWATREPAANAALLSLVVAEVEAGALHPVEPTTFPLDDVARALTDQVEGRIAGKAALVPG